MCVYIYTPICGKCPLSSLNYKCNNTPLHWHGNYNKLEARVHPSAHDYKTLCHTQKAIHNSNAFDIKQKSITTEQKVK